VFSEYALRNAKQADVVALIVDDPSGCTFPLASVPTPMKRLSWFTSCAALTYSMAHEVGHIIGARHDRTLDQKSSPVRLWPRLREWD
jgi:hypothetical protein